MKTLVMGLGNPILTDDGVGIHVARKVDSHLMSRATHSTQSEFRIRTIQLASGVPFGL